MNLYEKLRAVQSALKAPKGQENRFGGYKYRSCEDILEAVKPLLAENGLVLAISDEMVMVGERYYVRATATVTDGEQSFSTTAYAREPESRKGMDEAQVTGSSSSYARKYALNGLLAVDDTKDPDATNDHGKSKPQKAAPKPEPQPEVETFGHDYSKLAELSERYAAATGMSVEDAKKSIVGTYGNPKHMNEAKFRAVLLAIQSNIESLEGNNA